MATGRQGNPRGVARATEPVRLPLSRIPSPPLPISPERKREVARTVAQVPGQVSLQVRGGPRGGWLKGLMMKRGKALLLIAMLFLGNSWAWLPATARFTDSAQNPGNAFVTASYFPTDFYLHNSPTPPTGNTSSQAVLPLDTNSPTAATLYNYDQDRDAFAGLLVMKGASGAGETDPTKYQAWRSSSLSGGQGLTGTVTVELWTGIKDFGQNKAGEVTVFLRDFNGSTYTEIGSGTLYQANWQAGSSTWVKKTISVSGLSYTIPAGNRLEVRVIVGNSAGDDMWFAYDTTTYASVVRVPKT